jgi:hypothetical protein
MKRLRVSNDLIGLTWIVWRLKCRNRWWTSWNRREDSDFVYGQEIGQGLGTKRFNRIIHSKFQFCYCCQIYNSNQEQLRTTSGFWTEKVPNAEILISIQFTSFSIITLCQSRQRITQKTTDG